MNVSADLVYKYQRRVLIARATRRRRRGSSLILVMTLLGVLFVTGVVLLATMNFEAEMIAADRLRVQSESSIDAVFDEVASIARDSLMESGDVPFGGALGPESLVTFAELPGIQNVQSSIEPYERLDAGGVPTGEYYFPALTDARSLKNGPHDGSTIRRTFGRLGWPGLLANAESGVPEPEFGIISVDADGDGISDTLQFPLEDFGVPQEQIDRLSKRLNKTDQLNSKVNIGLRIIAHGGLVNLNESHPLLIKNVLDLPTWYDLVNDAGTLSFHFQHGPSLAMDAKVFYSPISEEPLLRRRNLLPPQTIAPSTLHGNPFGDSRQDLFGGGDMPSKLFAPSLDDRFLTLYSPDNTDFETVYDRSHRFEMFSLARDPGGVYIDSAGGGPDDPPAWALRMEPMTAGITDNNQQPWDQYDRRHLVTTVSYDDLLSRGGRWPVEDVSIGGVIHTTRDTDMVSRMRQANQAHDPLVDGVDLCIRDGIQPRHPLPFEYVDYPHDIENDCECPTSKEECRPNLRKGRLQLSMPWIDEERAEAQRVWDHNKDWGDRKFDTIERTIYDVFVLLLSNASGYYWEDVACSDPGSLVFAGACMADEFCAAFECVGGDMDGEECDQTTPGVCGAGDCLGRCFDVVQKQSRRWTKISRTAASLTANLIDFVDNDDIPTQIAIRSLDFEKPERAGLNYGFYCGDGDPTQEPCDGDHYCTGSLCLENRFDPAQPARYDEVQYVYGIEPQPYITEVATNSDGTSITGWGVELYNPYDTAIDLRNYYIVESAGTDLANVGASNWIKLRNGAGKFKDGLPSGRFMAFVPSGGAGELGVVVGPTPDQDKDEDKLADGYIEELGGGPATFKFVNGTTLYLVRSQALGSGVVVDQFTVNGTNTGVPAPAGAPPHIYSMQRLVQWVGVGSPPAAATTLWKAPVPVAGELSGTTLGKYNNASNVTVRAVEVQLAQTGFYGLNSKLGVVDEASFPTTGSLLLLMRHANRSVDDSLIDTKYKEPTLSGLQQRTVNNVALSFTSHLAEQTLHRKWTLDPYDLAGVKWISNELLVNPITDQTQIDNGRMPVFDVGVELGGLPPLPVPNDRFAHHVHPALGACCMPNAGACYETFRNECALMDADAVFVRGAQCSPNFCTVGACCMPDEENSCRDDEYIDDCTDSLGGQFVPGAKCSPQMCPVDNGFVSEYRFPGGVRNLPWGQLVFDYFTALPLDSTGPYTNPADDPEFIPGMADSIPRVDQDGLRVHGRINLNAAPWKVLAGLPNMPMEKFPGVFRNKLRDALRLDSAVAFVPDDEASTILPQTKGDPVLADLAMGIAAYRDSRQIAFKSGGGAFTTGLYGDPYLLDEADINFVPSYRGWVTPRPLARRGMGFLTVGELANVRHPNATGEDFRFDVGEVDRDPTAPLPIGRVVEGPDYIWAVSHLVALADWVTVRSQVFTVYGVLRGGADPNFGNNDLERARDVDSRALRFQETIDRLPTFLGSPTPARIGERVTAPYLDAWND